MTERRSTRGYRLAARLARREVFRRPGRTFLVALLVALPVAAMSIATISIRTEHQTPLQHWRQQYGQADAVIWPAAGATAAKRPGFAGRALAKLPPNSRVVNARNDVEQRLFRTVSSRRSEAFVSVLDMSDPMTRGILQITSGRAAKQGNEVVLTRTTARQLGVKAGDVLRFERPAHRSFTVSGVGEFAGSWGSTAVILPAGGTYPWKINEAVRESAQNVPLLVDLPPGISRTDVQRVISGATARGWSPQVSPALIPSQFDSNKTDTEQKVRWSWVIGALVLTVVGIVIAAAFATGARRQLVTLGQLAGNGASPKVLRRVLFLQGTLTGVLGSLGGLALSAVALAALAPHADAIFGKDVHPYIVRPSDVIPIVLLGVVAATVAALVPARTASRIPVLAALAGRKPLGRVPRWLPAAGALGVTGGLALLGLAVFGARSAAGTGPGSSQVWVFTAIIGGVAVLLGACAIAPLYVSVLEPAAARSRGSWRVATRSLARQRTRTSAVVSAIAAMAALAIAASSLSLGAHERNNANTRYLRADEVQLTGIGRDIGPTPPPAKFLADVAKVFPKSTRFQLHIVSRPNASFDVASVKPDHVSSSKSYVELRDGNAVVINPSATVGTPDVPLASSAVALADPALVAQYALKASDRHALARTGALVLADTPGRATLALTTHVAPNVKAPPAPTIDAAMVDGRDYYLGSLPAVLVTPAKAAALRLVTHRSMVVLRAPEKLTTEQRNTITDIAFDAEDAQAGTQAASEGVAFGYLFQSPRSGMDPLLVEWLLAGLALVLTLFVVAVNLALSAAETRDERDVLTVVGAAPGTMSRTSGYKAALLTVLGAALAVPVGLLPVAVFRAANHDGVPFVFPIRVVLLLIVAVPLVAGLATTAASAIALRVRPVRISTMAFD